MGSTQEDSDSPVTPEPDSSNPVSSVAEAVPLALAAYGDELPTVRREAPEVFSTRRLDQEACVVFMAGYVPSLGASASVCKAVTLEGNRRILGFVENGLRDASLVEKLFRDFLDRGFDLPPGLLCITSKAKHLSQVLPAALTAPIKWQQCQVHTREHMISYLCESDRVRIRGDSPPFFL